MEDVPHVAAVLHQERIVQTALVADAFHHLGVSVLPLKDLYRVAGAEAPQGEGGQRYRQENERRPH